MQIVSSADGTPIAFDRSGDGPPVIFVVGAFNERSSCAPLAGLLEGRHTVVTYDRRARGDSGDTVPYAIEREIEDLDALIAEVGGAAAVFGFSSGAILAMMAGLNGSRITKLALYEPSFPTDDGDWTVTDLPEQMSDLIAAGRPGDAVARFQTNVGLPAEVIAQLRQAPFWPALEKIAQSAVYDATLTRPGTLTADELGSLAIPTLVLCGAETWPTLQRSAQAVADALPRAQYRVLEGQNHDLDAVALAPELAAFF